MNLKNYRNMCLFFKAFVFFALLFPAVGMELQQIQQSSRRHIVIGNQKFEVNLDWHETQEEKLRLFYEKMGKTKNVATFCIVVKNEEGQILGFQEAENTLFISGYESSIIEKLGNEIGKDKFKCITDYCPKEPNKPKDFGLRKNIVEFFGFVERLNPSEKRHLGDAFKASLKEGADADFEEFSLKEKSIEKLTNACRATLDGRFFKDESNNFAKELGFIDKTKKTGSFEHIDDLFGTSFQLNFADREQTIRMFIENKDIKWNPQESTFIPMINELFEKRVYKEYIENSKKLDEEIRKLKKDRQSNKIEIKNKEMALKSLQDQNYLNTQRADAPLSPERR